MRHDNAGGNHCRLGAVVHSRLSEPDVLARVAHRRHSLRHRVVVREGVQPQ